MLPTLLRASDLDRHNKVHRFNSTETPNKEAKSVGKAWNLQPLYLIFMTLTFPNSESVVIHLVSRNLR